jgi:DNA-binding transcriptional ArsR family regulator
VPREPAPRDAAAAVTARSGPAATGREPERAGPAATGREPERAGAAATGRDPEAVARFVERFAAVLAEAGIARMPARVLAALLVTDNGSLTAAELAELLRVSPAAVSGAVRYLSQFGMVSRERVPGSRRDRYRVLDDVWFEASARRDPILASWESASREGIELLGGDTRAGQRFARSVEYFEFLRQELDGMMARWQAGKNARPPDRR